MLIDACCSLTCETESECDETNQNNCLDWLTLGVVSNAYWCMFRQF